MKSLIKIVSKRMMNEKKEGGERGEGGGVDADIHIDAIRELINESDKFIIEGKIVRLAECRGGGGDAGVEGVASGRRTGGEMMSNSDGNNADDVVIEKKKSPGRNRNQSRNLRPKERCEEGAQT